MHRSYGAERLSISRTEDLGYKWVECVRGEIFSDLWEQYLNNISSEMNANHILPIWSNKGREQSYTGKEVLLFPQPWILVKNCTQTTRTVNTIISTPNVLCFFQEKKKNNKLKTEEYHTVFDVLALYSFVKISRRYPSSEVAHSSQAWNREG